MSLPLKIATASLSIVIFAISLLAVLTYFKYEVTLSNLVRSRVQVIANDLQSTISSGLSLGLSLRELQTTQDVIDAIKTKDEQILSINVFERLSEKNAKTIFNTRKAGIGGTIRPLWLQTIAALDKKDPWHIKDDHADVVGINIVNNFDILIGGVGVRYSQKYLQKKKRTLLESLIFQSLTVLAIAGFIMVAGCYLLFHPLSQSFKKMADKLVELTQTGRIPYFTPQSEIENEFASFLKKSSLVIEEANTLHTLMLETKKPDEEISL